MFCCAASEVTALMKDEAAGQGLNTSSPNFWVLVAALKAFVVCAGVQSPSARGGPQSAWALDS